MSEQGASALPSQTTVECGICGGTINVSWFCKYCGGSLCDTCKQAHQKTPLFRNHLVVPRTMEVIRLHGPAKIAELCRFHTTKDISSYCDDCKVPCCVICQAEKHQRHVFTPIEDKYLSPEPTSFVPDVTLPIQNIPNFIPERDLIDIIRNKVGRVEYLEQKIGDKTKMDRKELQTPPVLDMAKKKSMPPAKRFDRADIIIADVRTLRTKIMARSLTAAASKSAWIMEYDVDTVHLINSMNVTIKSVTVSGSRGIRDMAMTKSGEMIVTCTDKKVRRVSVSNEVAILIDTELFYPDGVCLTDKEEIVLCMSGQDDRNHVVVYSPDGRRKLREIRGVDDQGKHLIRKPYRVVTNGKDLCVLNVNNVVCVDDIDFVKWMYDGRKAGQSSSFYPRGICVDKYHNLLVTDYNNHCVHYIDREGKLIQVILTQVQIKMNPCGVCVDDETGQVWVGNTLGNVVIANYLK